jgi:diguanylate cyclase (GGDEF)-like protein/PAS domain S-box-containing protein
MNFRNTIFNYLFFRVAVILFGVSMVFSFALMPMYQDKLVRMHAAQGNTFANTAVAACGEALYAEDFGFVINYIHNVLRKTPEVTYVNFISKEGMKLNLTAQGWKVEENMLVLGESLSADGNIYSIKRAREIYAGSSQNVFVFSKPVDISGLDWGVIELGISDAEYNSLFLSYLRNVFVFAVFLVLIALLMLHGSSKKLSGQLARLRETALKLSDGDLSARAPTEATGEIKLLASTLNSMAASLDTKTRSVRQLARLVESTHDAIAIFDGNGAISFVNAAFVSLTGSELEYYKGMSLQELFEHLDINKKKQREISAGMAYIGQLDWSTDITIAPDAQVPLHMTLRIEPLDSDAGDCSEFFVVLSDITKRKQLEFELESLEYFDKLTQLPNRRFFMDRLIEAVREAEVLADGLAVFLLDLDNFKLINDSLGHEVGDFVLSEVAWRIQDTLRSDDVVCRLGGDEFAVIIKSDNRREGLAKIAGSINKVVSDPIKYKDRELSIGTSIGIVCYPEDGKNEKELIKNADNAMYAAKYGVKNAYCFFAQNMHSDLQDHLELEGALRKAIVNSELQLVFQPFVDIDTQAVTSCEALLRWKHPERGYVPPDRFISIAEQAGLIADIGKWVFTEVCKQMQRWDFEIKVSVNVSGNELTDRNFVNRLENTLIEYGIEAHRVQLEFTEHVVVSKDGGNLSILNALKSKGFVIAVDDFGTGFSSLSYITELPVDIIKIDKSFISKLPEDGRTIAVVKSILSLATSLGMMTVGEGAETKQQVEWLNDHGCKKIQGYYFYKPMTAEELGELMMSRLTSDG